MSRGLFKRGNVWWARIYHQGKEKKFSTQTGSYEDARRRREAKLHELIAEDWGEQPPKTFDEASKRFVDEYLPLLRPTTRRRYFTSLIHLAGHFEGKRLDKVGSAVLHEFEIARRQHVTASTIIKDLNCLSSLFSRCQEWEWIRHNPVPAYKRSRKRAGLQEGATGRRWFTFDEEDLVLEATRSRKLRQLFTFDIDTGLRRNELFRLQTSHINLTKNHIEVTPDIAKGGKRRIVPLLPRARDIAIELMSDVRSPYLFTTDDGRPYSPNSMHVWKELKISCHRAGIAPATLHDLRRTYGCRRLQAGATMEKVAELMGHSSVTTTERIYAFLREDLIQEAGLMEEDRAGHKPEHPNVVYIKSELQNKELG